MPDYEVTIKETEVYLIKVSANSSDKAEQKAWKMLDDGGREEYHNYSEGESDAVEI